jgi:hypothetical protein
MHPSPHHGVVVRPTKFAGQIGLGGWAKESSHLRTRFWIRFCQRAALRRLPRGEPNWEVPTIVTVNPLHTMSSASSAWTTVNVPVFRPPWAGPHSLTRASRVFDAVCETWADSKAVS